MTYSKCNSLQLFSAQSMQMSMWSCGIAHFYILFNMSSFFPVYFSVYMPMSASLYHCHLSLHIFGSHWKCMSLCVIFFYFSFDSSFLFQPLSFPYLFPIFWILLSTLSSLSTWRNTHCFINSVLYLTSSVTTSNSETSCISNCSLVKEDKSPPSNSFLDVL